MSSYLLGHKILFRAARKKNAKGIFITENILPCNFTHVSSSFEVNKMTRMCNCLQDQTLSLSFLSSASVLKDDESVSVAWMRVCKAHGRS